jgi:hypothetical protein
MDFSNLSCVKLGSPWIYSCGLTRRSPSRRAHRCSACTELMAFIPRDPYLRGARSSSEASWRGKPAGGFGTLCR